jgi:hypothetical protein
VPRAVLAVCVSHAGYSKYVPRIARAAIDCSARAARRLLHGSSARSCTCDGSVERAQDPAESPSASAEAGGSSLGRSPESLNNEGGALLVA